MARLTATEKLLKLQPSCTYCGGSKASTSRDHAPPITLFDGRDRPAGLEFGACDECHQGTRDMDLIASIMSRIYQRADRLPNEPELADLMKQFVGRYPNLASEFNDAEPVNKNGIVVGYAIKIGDGFLTRVVEAFAARISLAIWREIVGRPLLSDRAVWVRWWSNVESMQDKIPQNIFELVGNPQTLKAGKKEVSDQFTYQWAIDPKEEILAIFVTFRFAFAFTAFISIDADRITKHSRRVYRPGFLKGWKPPSGRGANLRALHDAAKQAGLTIVIS